MNETILAVDDDPGLLNAVQMMLEMAGYQVFAAGDGYTALEILKAQPIDLIVADIAMPGMNGYQLYTRVSKNPRWARIPFIFLSARGMDSDIRFGKELGVDDYLIKPMKSDDLLATVRGKLKRFGKWDQLPAEVTEDYPSTNGFGSLDFGWLKIETTGHQAWVDGRPVKLSSREYGLIYHLAKHAGQIITTGELVHITHGLETDHRDAGALLRPLVRSLRRKLGYSAGEMGCIQNIRGVGYQFVPPE